jgi:peptidoglycan hydrolase-like protein with peptidoglycan-binding domain
VGTDSRPSRGLIVVAAILALALCAAPDAHAGALKRGAKGPRVAFVQKVLGQHVDRIFGKQTKRAVKRFQRRHGLTADGIVGPATWSALKRARGRSSRAGRSGRASVHGLQRALGIAADGVFGPGTLRAVKHFQRSHGLTADGVVGPATWAALGHPGVTKVLKRRRGATRSRGGGLPITVRRVIAAASRIAHKPYRYGGGHGSFNDTGYDCSGSVSYALHGGGLLSAPQDSGQLMSYGAPGRGRYITIYSQPGHVYMVVHGRRFDTSGQDAGSRWQWDMRSTAGYTVRHPPGL